MVYSIGVQDSRTFTASHFNCIRKDTFNICYNQGTSHASNTNIATYILQLLKS